jgi:hypothetical protein
MENPISVQVSPVGPAPCARPRAPALTGGPRLTAYSARALSYPSLSPAARWASPVSAVFFEHAHGLSRWLADPTSQTPCP